MERQEVYNLIDGERDYQSIKWSASNHRHSPLEFSVYMKDYLEELQHINTRNSDESTWDETRSIMRKVTAMGVACMEAYGAPERIIVPVIPGA